jgi:DNA-binding phage protein
MGSTKKRKPKLLSDQLREILDDGPMTRYRLSKEAGVDQGQLSRFVLGKGQLTFHTLDKIGSVLGLRFVLEQKSESEG